MSFPTRLEQLLEQDRLVVRGMIKFEFGGGHYGVWNGNHDLVWEGLTYVPNQLIGVDEPSYSTGMAASEFKIRMPASADFGVTPDVLAEIEDQEYKGRPATVYEAYFDPDTRALLHVEPLHFGYADTVDHVTEGGQFMLVGNIITGALDNHRDGYRTASHEDQQLVSPGDLGFKNAGTVRTEYFDIEL